MWPAVALVAGAVVLVAVLSVLLVRRRRTVWHRFAERHGLDFRIVDEGPRVVGTVDGRRLRLATHAATSDRETLGVEAWRLTTPLEGDLPPGLRVEAADGPIGTALRAVEGRGVTTGDETFDGAVLVTADDEAAARAWLVDERRRALLAFLEAVRPEIGGLEGGELFVEGRTVVARTGDLEQWQASLFQAARRLEYAGS